ncbi:MAG TPA: choice-of-anchor tandem repeat GloVer-containing protein [Rhizomicrobium sp.]|nr:choice-of-anchor tandem repeat GloVer-containing protein [Rhizomicrobium sp.]
MKGTLYGTTALGGKWDGGTVFSLDEKSGAEKVLYSFCSRENCTDGGYPDASVIDVNGALYGTTPYGGANCQSNGGCGTVFALNPGTGAETVVYSFGSQQSAIDGANPYASVVDVEGTLFGTTAYGGANCRSSGGCGTVFAVDPMTGGETVSYSFCSHKDCTDGANPAAGLIAVNHKLYGTTADGGIAGCYGSGCGTLFVLKEKR